MLLLSVILTWFAVLAPSMAETEAERRVATLEYKFARHERKLEDVEKELYAIGRNQGVLTNKGCPLEFERFEGSCYFFDRNEVEWENAVKECSIRSPGAYLVVIDNEDENDFIKGKASTIKGNHWVGLTDAIIEGEYMWWHTGHVIINEDFIDWGSGEPSGGFHANCVVLNKNQNYQWAVLPCTRTFTFICETEEKMPT